MSTISSSVLSDGIVGSLTHISYEYMNFLGNTLYEQKSLESQLKKLSKDSDYADLVSVMQEWKSLLQVIAILISLYRTNNKTYTKDELLNPKKRQEIIENERTELMTSKMANVKRSISRNEQMISRLVRKRDNNTIQANELEMLNSFIGDNEKLKKIDINTLNVKSIFDEYQNLFTESTLDKLIKIGFVTGNNIIYNESLENTELLMNLFKKDLSQTNNFQSEKIQKFISSLSIEVDLGVGDLTRPIIIDTHFCINSDYENITKTISNIYHQYDFVYLCFAPGRKVLIPSYMINTINNNPTKKMAIIYMQDKEMGEGFTPFWENGKEALINILTPVDKLLKNNLKITCITTYLPSCSDLYEVLNKIIVRPTFIHIGFTTCGAIENQITNKMTFGLLANNQNILFIGCDGYKYGGSEFVKLTGSTLYDSSNLDKLEYSINPSIEKLFNSNVMSGGKQSKYYLKYMKYKKKYLKLKRCN